MATTTDLKNIDLGDIVEKDKGEPREKLELSRKCHDSQIDEDTASVYKLSSSI